MKKIKRAHSVASEYTIRMVFLKTKILTQGSRNLFLHVMHMWPQMINGMFWTFAIKAFAKWHNSLQINIIGKSPESILYGIKVEDIPVNSYHTLFPQFTY